MFYEQKDNHIHLHSHAEPKHNQKRFSAKCMQFCFLIARRPKVTYILINTWPRIKTWWGCVISHEPKQADMR